MFFVYPEDKNCNALQYQYFYGPGVMVAPVTEENSTTTQIYMPDDIFYDFYTHETVRGNGSMITLTNVAYTTIPLYYKGGSIVALRAKSANTTHELRMQDFTVVIAPSLNGTATGNLYLDDGVSIVQPKTSYITFNYSKGKFSMTGSFGYSAGVSITSVVVLGSTDGTQSSSLNIYSDLENNSRNAFTTSIPLTGPHDMQIL